MNKKTIIKMYGTILLFCSILITVSCSTDDQDIITSKEESSKAKIATLAANTPITYYSTPNNGNAVPNSSLNVLINGSCGIHWGGSLKAQVLAQNGPTMSIRVSLQSGLAFGGGGTAYIKANSLCGPVAGSVTYSPLFKYVDIPVTGGFTQGVKHFYPMIIQGTNPATNRQYAEPALMYTIPMYNTNWVYGNILGTVNGVEVRCNGTNNLSVAYGANNQCTEFCNRYYLQVYNKNIIDVGTQGGNSNTWFDHASDKGLVGYANEQTTVAPRPGDILCMSGGSGGLGHVAIIIEVGYNYVKIAQQNTGTSGGEWAPIGASLAYNPNTKTITPPFGYGIDGWLRNP